MQKPNRIQFLMTAWLLVALTVLLVPAPRSWGRFGRWVNPYYDKVHLQLEVAVHIVLMASVSLLIMHSFRTKMAMAAFTFSMALAILLAALLEGLQSFLPIEFGRQCDINDLFPSTMGILMGCIVGLIMRLLRS